MYRSVILLFCINLTIYINAQVPQRFQDEKTGKYGYKDASGKVIVKPIYDIAYDEFKDGKYAEVNIGAHYDENKGGKWGIIDNKGKLIFPVKYDRVRCLGYNLFALNIGHVFSNMDASPSGKIAIFNAAGKQLTPFIYQGFLTAIEFEEGFARLEMKVNQKQKYGLLDSTGKVAIPVKYDDVGGFREGRCRVDLNGKSGFIDKSGKMVIPIKYEHAYNFSEGLASVKLNGKCGFINVNGKEVIALQYEDAKYFEEGYAAVKKNGKWGVINKENKVIVDFMHEEIYWIKEDANRIRIKRGKDYLEVDRQGNEIKN